MKKSFTRPRISPAKIVLLSFLALIVVGTGLLMLPISTREAGGAPFLDAMFTAVSASCVTGLVVHDTAQYWSAFGQGVILVLIQIGGMGVITVAVVLSVLGGKKISIRRRWIMQESISAPHVGGIIRMTDMLILGSLTIEAVGAVLLMFRFIPEYGARGIWYGIFHSVSAFCNAGFDLMGVNGTPCASMTRYSKDLYVSIVLSLIILIGGLGFTTWADIRTNGRHLKRYTLQSKLILATTAALLAGAFAFNYLYEFSLPQWADLKGTGKAAAALFQTVTPRTAGFNTVDLTRLSPAGKLIMLLQMLVGGAPGSTAGGFKMTTIAVLFLAVRATFRNKDNVYAFHRRIPEKSVRNAAALAGLYVFLFVSAGVFICCFDHVPMISALFETASAVATVGLSLGITASLSIPSRIILMMLMYFGRVGGLTLLYALNKKTGIVGGEYPMEDVAIG